MGVKMGTIRLDRQEPYLDGEQLDALIQRWLDECADRLDDLGPNGYTGTTAGYAYKIAYFREWWAEVGPQTAWRLTQRRLRDFERWLRMRRSKRGVQLMYHTRRDALRRLRAMFRWAQSEGYLVSVAPADWVPAAAGESPVRQLVSDDKLTALLAATEQTACPLRNRTILAVLIGTGIRRKECALLSIEDVRFATSGKGILLIRHPKKTKRGLVLRDAAFDAITGDYLRRWLAANNRASGPLFPSSKRGRHATAGQRHLHPNSVSRIVKQCWDIAGLEADQPAHDLRRTFITDWRRHHRGEDVDHLLQLQAGHADASQTSQYSLQGSEDLLEIISSPMTRVGAAVANWSI